MNCCGIWGEIERVVLVNVENLVLGGLLKGWHAYSRTGSVYYYVDRVMRGIILIRMEWTIILWAVSVGTSAENKLTFSWSPADHQMIINRPSADHIPTISWSSSDHWIRTDQWVLVCGTSAEHCFGIIKNEPLCKICSVFDVITSYKSVRLGGIHENLGDTKNLRNGCARIKRVFRRSMVRASLPAHLFFSSCMIFFMHPCKENYYLMSA